MITARSLLALMVLAVACTTPQGGPTGSGGEASTTPTAGDGVEPADSAELTCWTTPVSGTPGEIRFEDATEAFGLVEPLTGMHGHAAAFGQVDADLIPDLVVGTFGDREPDVYQVRGAAGPSPDRLLLSGADFSAEPWSEELGRTSGSVFADFDGDSDDDLLLVRHAGVDGEFPVPTRIFENQAGTLTAHSEPLPPGFRGRTPAVADFDGDGQLDIYISEDSFGETGGLLLRNDGRLDFTDATADSGLGGLFALSAAAGDLNRDLRPDLVTSSVVLINKGDMAFEDATPGDFAAVGTGEEDEPAGVALGDLNRDGVADIVVGQHYRATVEDDTKVPVRVFLGNDEATGYQEITGAADLTPLPTLAPHVAVADVDNDGWPDIVTTASAAEGSAPAVYRNTGEDPLRFEVSEGLGSDQYWIGGPMVDIDRDGRLDLFAVEWEPSLPSLLFRNAGDSGHWLEVSIGEPGAGIGSLVTVTTTEGDLIGAQEIGVGGGYSSGRLPVAHFGLGSESTVAVTITHPDGSTTEIPDVFADQHLRWPEGC